MKPINNNEVQELAFFGYSYNFDDICLVYPLTLKNKISMGNRYEQLLGLITLNKTAILASLEGKIENTKDFADISVIEYLTKSCYFDKTIESTITAALTLLTHEDKITILYDEGIIIFGGLKEKRLLNSQNFSSFQNVIRLQNGINIDKTEIVDESPHMKKFREKEALRDFYKNKQKDGDKTNVDFLKILASLCIYLKTTPSEIENMSILAYISLSGLAQKQEAFTTEVAFRAGGAEIKTPMKHWIEK